MLRRNKKRHNRKKIYIIEHLEPKLWKWCLIEYEHISKIVGKKYLWFGNIKNRKDAECLGKYGKVITKSIKQLNLKNACVLDPEAKKTLNPKEAKSFDYFIFGGILGDYPPKKRTQKELSKFLKNCEKRNIGKEQMSTDNAVFCVKKIVDGKNLRKMKFADKIEIKINAFESVVLPYRYNVVKKKPLISKKLVDYIKIKGI